MYCYYPVRLLHHKTHTVVCFKKDDVFSRIFRVNWSSVRLTLSNLVSELYVAYLISPLLNSKLLDSQRALYFSTTATSINMWILEGERNKGPESENLESSLSSAPPLFSSFQISFSAIHVPLWEKTVPHIYIHFNLKSLKWKQCSSVNLKALVLKYNWTDLGWVTTTQFAGRTHHTQNCGHWEPFLIIGWAMSLWVFNILIITRDYVTFPAKIWANIYLP